MKSALLACCLCCVADAAAAADEAPICADRPGLSTPTCTVPPGLIQVETLIAGWGHDRSGGLESAGLVIGDTALKVGITDRLHLELDVTAYHSLRVREGTVRATVSGFGDMAVAGKYRLTSDNAPVQIAARPFVTIPTAKRSLGIGKVQGGLVVPIGYSIPGTPLSLALSPEIDLNADPVGSGYHLATGQVIGLGGSLTPAFSASVELAGYWDFAPGGTVRQYLLGGSAALLFSNDVQLDAGANLGLNRESPDVELYTGLALRF